MIFLAALSLLLMQVMHSIYASPATVVSSINNLGSSFITTIKEAKTHIVAGAVARGVSIFAMYPLDTIKTRLQMKSKESLRDTLNALSITQLFSGVGGSLIGQIPYGMLTFGSYETYKKKLIEKFPDRRPEGLYFISAILGDLTGTLWVVPSEVLKQSVQSGQYKSIGSAFSSIVSTSGVGGLYRGLSGQVVRDVPFRAIQLPTYEIVKNAYRDKFCVVEDCSSSKKKDKCSSGTCTKTKVLRDLNSAEATMIGVVAGTFTAAVTTPLDVLKTRVMTGTGSSSGGVFATAIDIAREEGISGLFSGLGPRCVYIGPSCGIFFLAYEKTKQVMIQRASIQNSC